MSKIYNVISKICKITFGSIFLCFIIAALFIRAKYDYADFPFFTGTGVLDFLLLAAGGILILILIKNKVWIKYVPDGKIVIGVFVSIALIFVLLVPLKPFSDMEQIYDAALQVINGKFHEVNTSNYFLNAPNNLVCVYIYAFILYIFPASILTLKILNIILIVAIGILSKKILEEYISLRYDNVFYVFVFSFLSVILYVNHIYTDILFTVLTLWSYYIFLKKKNGFSVSCIILGISYFIRPIAIIYLIAYSIVEIFKIDNWKRKLINICTGLLLFFGIVFTFSEIIDDLQNENNQSLPVASYLYMGLNKEEFGFQDGSHDVNRTMDDVMNRLKSYSMKDIVSIGVKKTFWTWTEGTYQAERYAFGEGVENELDKFEYVTPVTGFIKNPDQKVYSILESIMRTQYLIFAIMALIGAFKVRKEKKWDTIILLFIGYFLFYLLWEIKSRYIFSLYPFMIILAWKAVSSKKFVLPELKFHIKK